MSTPQQPGQDPQGGRRPFAVHAQVPVDPYALGAAAPLGGPDDPSAPPAPATPRSGVRAASAEAAVPAGEPTPFGAVPDPTGSAQQAGPISFVPGVTQDPPAPAAPAATDAQPGPAAAYAGGAAAAVPPTRPEPAGEPAPAAAPAEPAPAAAPAEPAPAETPAEPAPDASGESGAVSETAEPGRSSETAAASAAVGEHPAPSAEQRVAAAEHDTVVDAEAADPRLVWDDGEELALAGRVVLGRNPNDEDDATVVAVRDETLSLSKTHFEIELAGGEAWLTDRHSTNGVTIVRGGERIIAEPGERTPLRAGDALEMGDRIATFQEATA